MLAEVEFESCLRSYKDFYYTVIHLLLNSLLNLIIPVCSEFVGSMTISVESLTDAVFEAKIFVISKSVIENDELNKQTVLSVSNRTRATVRSEGFNST